MYLYKCMYVSMCVCMYVSMYVCMFVCLLANFFASQCSADSEDDALINAPFPLPEKHPTFQFGPVSQQTVLRHLLQLSPSKLTADNFCSNLIIRECAPLSSSQH